MNEESLVLICTTSFSAEDIESAKGLLFESITTTKRRITRKRDGRSKRDLYDVIAVFKETDPEEVPIFVARELQKLPPISFDHIDATRLLKDILVIQKDLQNIKDTYVTTENLEEVKADLINLKKASLVNNYDFYVNKKRGGGISESYCMDSGPSGLTHIEECNDMIHNSTAVASLSPPSPRACESVPRSTCERPVGVQVRTNDNASQVEALDRSPMVSVVETTVKASAIKHAIITDASRQCISMSQPGISEPRQEAVESLAKIVSTEGEWKEERPKEEWIVAQRKRLRNRFSTLEGKAPTNTSEKFRAADVKTPLFINNVDGSTSEKDIMEYIFSKTQVHVSLQKIKAKVPKQYNAYKMYVPNSKISLFLDGSLWPEGIYVRRFIEFKSTQYGRQNDDK